MSDEAKVAEVPEEIKTPDEVIDNKRAEIENLVIAHNDSVDKETPEPEIPLKKEETVEEQKEIDPVQRIKDSTQKRIDKVIAKQKSAEDQLAEARAEIERLKNSPKTPEVISKTEEEAKVTPDQVVAYIAKMSEQGNHKEVAEATRFLIKLEKDIAIEELNQVQTQASSVTQRQNEEMKALANDYVELDSEGLPDNNSDMTLANQKGLLFKLSMDYWNDKAKHAERYNNSNVVEGFRRSVADAYRDIQEHNRTTPREEKIIEKRNPRQVLAEPGADTSDEAPQGNSNSLSDADKVRAEIHNRTKNRYLRKPPQ